MRWLSLASVLLGLGVWEVIGRLSPRPATIQCDISVPFPRPRYEALKTTPAFLEIRRTIWSLLKHGAEAELTHG